MAKSGDRGTLIGARVLGLLMAGSGLAKLAGESHGVAMFALMGLPNWFLALVGTFELIGGILLMVPAATPVGSLILSTIMVGALWAHTAHSEWIQLLPVAVLLILLLTIFRRTQSRAAQMLGGA